MVLVPRSSPSSSSLSVLRSLSSRRRRCGYSVVPLLIAFRLRDSFVGAFASSSPSSSSSFSSLAAARSSPFRFAERRAPFVRSVSPALPSTRGGDVRLSASTMTTTSSDADAATTASGSPLARLRAEMSRRGADCWIVPSDDPHLSEYVAAAYGRRAFVSGFDGSAGTAIVTADEAILSTDGRYWNQAGLQLDGGEWTLHRAGASPDALTVPGLVAAAAKKHRAAATTTTTTTTDEGEFVVGVDPYAHAASFAAEIEEALKADDEDDDVNGDGNNGGKTLGRLDTSLGNLVDVVWGEDRPPVPTAPFRAHPLEHAGEDVRSKLERIRAAMRESSATVCVLPALDEVAWTLNLRATGDVHSCPVGIAYVTVGLDDAALYCDPAKVNDEDVAKHLDEAGVTVKPYDDVADDLVAHLESAASSSSDQKPKVWLDTKRCNYALARLVPPNRLRDAPTFVADAKAVKNDAELAGMRRAHAEDGAAMARFISWLETEISVHHNSVSEVEIDRRLTAERARIPAFNEVSFDTIAGVGGNGAIVHYRAEEGSDLLAELDGSNPVLIDSGGQYDYGTTDVTRTWHFGEDPDDDFREAYTRVLKGHIALDTTVWPDNTPGFVLDAFARQHLWRAGMDYGHGTGHGVGAALNVHEGPISVSPRWRNTSVLKAGMVISNEPGYYKEGVFGVRVENLVEVVRSDVGDSEKGFLEFRKLTKIPIQQNLIKKELVTDAEADWLDRYHEEVLEVVGPLLEEGSPAKEWLVKSCRKFER